MKTARGKDRHFEFVHLEIFERTRTGVISDDEMTVLEDEFPEKKT